MPVPKKDPQVLDVDLTAGRTVTEEWPVQPPEEVYVPLIQERVGGQSVAAYYWSGGLLWWPLENELVPAGARALYVRVE